MVMRAAQSVPKLSLRRRVTRMARDLDAVEELLLSQWSQGMDCLAVMFMAEGAANRSFARKLIRVGGWAYMQEVGVRSVVLEGVAARAWDVVCGERHSIIWRHELEARLQVALRRDLNLVVDLTDLVPFQATTDWALRPQPVRVASMLVDLL